MSRRSSVSGEGGHSRALRFFAHALWRNLRSRQRGEGGSSRSDADSQLVRDRLVQELWFQAAFDPHTVDEERRRSPHAKPMAEIDIALNQSHSPRKFAVEVVDAANS